MDGKGRYLNETMEILTLSNLWICLLVTVIREYTSDDSKVHSYMEWDLSENPVKYLRILWNRSSALITQHERRKKRLSFAARNKD